MSRVDDWLDMLSTSPYHYYYNSHYESPIEKWVKNKLLNELKQIDEMTESTKGDTMTIYEKKGTKIELNNKNLPTILEQLANRDCVQKIEANKEDGWIKITWDKGTAEFHYGTHINILDTGVYPAVSSNTKYTAYFTQYVSEYLVKLYYSSNVLRIDLNSEVRRLYVYTEKGNFSIFMGSGVIVFDDDDEFVEMFESDKCSIDEDMREHGYEVKNEE